MVHKIKFGIFFIITAVLLLMSFGQKGNVETNLLKTLLPQNISDTEDIVSIANKSSSVIKVVFEAENESDLEVLYRAFYNGFDKNFFEINTPDITPLLNLYTSRPTNFLSYEMRNLLKEKKYDDVYAQSINSLYNPAGFQITSFEKDPYLLLDNFLMSNKKMSPQKDNFDGKYYDFISLKIKNSDVLSPDLSNKKTALITDLQKKLSAGTSKIYLAGTPIHSFYTSQKSKTDINIICILSTFLIVFLTWHFFRNLKLLIPIALSIIFGMLAGYTATKLWFDTFQIITMVFSTTLIGLGIDYSYHYFFAEKTDKNFVKNLSFSLLTTLIPFVLLYFTKIELLKQVSVFSVFGLTGIYFTVLFLYPCFGKNYSSETVNINGKQIKTVLIFLLLFSLGGLLRFRFNDTLTAFYTPDNNLKKAEFLYNRVSDNNVGNTQFIVVKRNSAESAVKEEEKITDTLAANNIDFICLSKIFPSKERQEENFSLVKDLYKNNLDKYSDILSQKQISDLKNESFSPALINFEQVPFSDNFMLNPTASVIYAFSDKIPEITDENVSVIDFQKNIKKQIKEYRKVLMLLLPIVLLVLTVILTCIYGLKKAVRILIPPMTGMFSAVLLASLICGEINLFGIIAAYLILGFTMDYSIFRTNSEEKTETAITVSCITTSFSFLLLAFCGFKLLSSMAMVLFFGIIISYMTGLLIFKKL